MVFRRLRLRNLTLRSALQNTGLAFAAIGMVLVLGTSDRVIPGAAMMLIGVTLLMFGASMNSRPFNAAGIDILAMGYMYCLLGLLLGAVSWGNAGIVMVFVFALLFLAVWYEGDKKKGDGQEKTN